LLKSAIFRHSNDNQNKKLNLFYSFVFLGGFEPLWLNIQFFQKITDNSVSKMRLDIFYKILKIQSSIFIRLELKNLKFQKKLSAWQ